jgi:hypothetical protein
MAITWPLLPHILHVRRYESNEMCNEDTKVVAQFLIFMSYMKPTLIFPATISIIAEPQTCKWRRYVRPLLSEV